MEKRRNSARGQGLVEYAILIALIALLAIGVLLVTAGAINRSYGIVGGALGVKHDVRDAGNNNIYFAMEPPQCGPWLSAGGDGKLYLEMQFFSQIPIPDLSVATNDPNITPVIVTNTGAGSGVGNLQIQNYIIPDGMQCPLSLVIQSDAAYGSETVAMQVLQKPW